jgi:simple sugar transport system ATP-binding protein
VTDTAPTTNGATTADEIFSAKGITKRFGAVTALRGVDLHLRRGEILGVVGDNGAGKSTLVKILTGYQAPTTGQLYLEGKPVSFRSVRDARDQGIETIFQDLALVNELSVYHNLFLNRELVKGGGMGFLSNRKMRAEARAYLEQIKINLPSVDVPVEKLSGGQRQAIAVAPPGARTSRFCCSTSRCRPWAPRRPIRSSSWSGACPPSGACR